VLRFVFVIIRGLEVSNDEGYIKDSFSGLRDSVPALNGEKASRAQILKKAADYISFMRRKNTSVQADIDDLKRQNKVLEEQIRSMEKAKSSGITNFSGTSLLDATNHDRTKIKSESVSSFDGVSDSDSISDSDGLAIGITGNNGSSAGISVLAAQKRGPSNKRLKTSSNSSESSSSSNVVMVTSLTSTV